jgi:hypothetical protein
MWIYLWVACTTFILCTQSFGVVERLPTEQCNRQNTMPYFIKLHKVGSEGIARSLGHGRRGNFRYNNETCTAGPPFGHNVAVMYGRHGRSKIQSCNILTPCSDQIIVLRNPLERLMSQFHFYNVWNSLIPNYISLLNNSFEVSAKFSKFLANSTSVSPQEMRVLLDAFGQAEQLDFHPYMYEVVLSQNFNHSDRLSNETLDAAVQNLRNDFDVVGTTENMASMFVLLSKVVDINLNDTCVAKMGHGMKREYQKQFKTSTRPRAAELLSSETYAFLLHALYGEITLWQTAATIHQEMIKKHYLISVDKAKNLWEKTCPKLYFYPRNYSK